MKQIYEQGTLQMVRSQNNLVFVAKQDEHEGKTSIVYRMYDCGTGAVSPVTRSVFLLAKFGNIFEQFENDPNEFISCKAVVLPDFRTLIVLKNGSAVIYGKDGKIEWSGHALYKDQAPSALAVSGNTVWAAYKNPSAVIAYSAEHNLRRTLRIGGDGDLPTGLCGLYVCDDGALRVCAADEKKIIEVDTERFTFKNYMSFTDPVTDYEKINSNEFVLTEKGIFRL